MFPTEENINNIKKLVEEGYISVRNHPKYPYFIYNYTAKTQYSSNWCVETLNCRGLILDEDYKIIARGMQKFFNYAEYNKDSKIGELPPYKTFDVYEKLDGSLIIMSEDDENIIVATRGSFESEQSNVAREILKEKYPKLQLNKNLSYLMEVIYPENRIVVDYEGTRELILLAIIDNKTGKDVKWNHVESFGRTYGIPVVKKYDFNSKADIGEAIAGNAIDNAEGYVIQFDTGLRVKVKFAEYVRLHRLITGVSNKSVWEMLRAGESIEALLEKVPDEFFKWVKKTSKRFKKKYDKIEKESKKIIDDGREFQDRKAVAEYFKEHKKYQSILFAMYDDKKYEDIIWKMLRPKYAKPFKEDV